MFCALAEFFLFLLHLTNVNKHFWRRCRGSNWCEDFDNNLDVC